MLSRLRRPRGSLAFLYLIVSTTFGFLSIKFRDAKVARASFIVFTCGAILDVFVYKSRLLIYI